MCACVYVSMCIPVPVYHPHACNRYFHACIPVKRQPVMRASSRMCMYAFHANISYEYQYETNRACIYIRVVYTYTIYLRSTSEANYSYARTAEEVGEQCFSPVHGIIRELITPRTCVLMHSRINAPFMDRTGS